LQALERQANKKRKVRYSEGISKAVWATGVREREGDERRVKEGGGTRETAKMKRALTSWGFLMNVVLQKVERVKLKQGY
jgi:hypothetical protein